MDVSPGLTAGDEALDYMISGSGANHLARSGLVKPKARLVDLMVKRTRHTVRMLTA